LPWQRTIRIAARSCTSWQGDRHLPVEPARTQESRVEDLRPVGRRQHHDANHRVEVHLREQLVQRLLPLVVGDQRALAGPPLPDRIYLVYEDDGRGTLTSLCEQATYPGRADPDEHLHETRP
jgi:hypothetical protein